MARQETGDLANDDGTYIRVCFDVLSRFGVCDEYLWPYDETKVKVSPSLMAQRQAAGHKIHSYYRIPDTGNPQDRIDAIVTALRAQHPVVFGTQVSYDFMQLLGTTPQKPPTGNIAGGHAMVIMGFINGWFLVKNSWGTGWGDGGYCYFDPSYITWDQTTDLWVPTLAMNLAT
jgi:C1A family cysteine protease